MKIRVPKIRPTNTHCRKIVTNVSIDSVISIAATLGGKFWRGVPISGFFCEWPRWPLVRGGHLGGISWYLLQVC